MAGNDYPIMGSGFLPEEDSPDFWGFEDKVQPKMKAASIVTDAEIDLRPFTSPRHNQMHSSSCVAQAVVKALEIQRILKHGKDAHVDLSRLAVYYLARNLMFPPATNEDGGTFVRLACDTLRRYGVCTEEEWPFDLGKVYTPPSWMAMRKAYVHKIDSFYTIRARGQDRVESVILALAAGCPVVFGAAVGRNWNDYRTFITGHEEPLKPPKDITGWHATVILGWKDGQFIGENSWGKGWGHDGFYYMSPEYIASDDHVHDFWVMISGYEPFMQSKGAE